MSRTTRLIKENVKNVSTKSNSNSNTIRSRSHAQVYDYQQHIASVSKLSPLYLELKKHAGNNSWDLVLKEFDKNYVSTEIGKQR